MKLDSLMKLYVHELKDLHSAESQIIDELPKMIDKVNDDGLRDALTEHLDETRTHIQRIERIFEGLDFEPHGHKCKGVAGLIVEGREIISDVAEPDVMDAAIISACQRVEHYEMAAYGVARAFARKLGRSQDAEVLTTTIEEEGAADRRLSHLAEHHINFVATVAG